MSELMEFKCPFCGGRMAFDSILQKMKCPYCDSEMDVDQFQDSEMLRQEVPLKESFELKSACGGEWQAEELNAMRVYGCQSCGGEIIADETTGASSCPYCGNLVVMKGQFSGGLRPDLIIPFKNDKQRAKEAYLSHLRGKFFLPKVFKEENHIDEIKGLYVPFWVFDADVEADCAFNAEQRREWGDGNKRYVETKYFQVERGGSVSFSAVPADASKKMEDTLMESIEPYITSKAVPFMPAYLSGFMADRYDVEVTERLDRAKERIRASALKEFRNMVKGYHMVVRVGDQTRILKSRYRYALFPVWILNTTWRGKKFVFAMNGQTGKITGDLPLDKGAFARFVLIWGTVIAAALYAMEWIFVLLQ